MGSLNASKVDDWLQPMNLELLKCWARDFSLGDVAVKMGVSHKTLIEWRKKYPEIDEAIREGKEIIDYRVENALLRRALGFTTTETKTVISPPDKHGNRAIRVEKTEKEVLPDPTAIMCWLNNRKPEQWKRNRDNIRQLTDDESKITVNIIRHAPDKDEEKWDVSAQKGKAKKAPTPQEDLDAWPDDWEDDE